MSDCRPVVQGPTNDYNLQFSLFASGYIHLESNSLTITCKLQALFGQNEAPEAPRNIMPMASVVIRLCSTSGV